MSRECHNILTLTAQNIIELNGRYCPLCFSGTWLWRNNNSQVYKGTNKLIIKEVQRNTVIYRHWYDSPWVFCSILPKAAIIKPQMTLNNTTIDMAFRSSFPSGNKTISFLPILKIKCTALAPSVRCLTSKLPFLVRMKIVLVLFFKINSSVFLSFLIHTLINLRHSMSLSAQRVLQVYTYACLCTPSHTPGVGFILFPV